MPFGTFWSKAPAWVLTAVRKKGRQEKGKNGLRGA